MLPSFFLQENKNMSNLVVEITNNATATGGDLNLGANERIVIPFTNDTYVSFAAGSRQIREITLHTTSAGGVRSPQSFFTTGTGATSLARVKVGTLTTQGNVAAYLDSNTF